MQGVFMLNHLFEVIRASLLFTLMLLLTSTGIAAAKECLECHQHIGTAFSSVSHHIQGPEISGKQCYACHWEATPTGATDRRYHQKKRNKIDLVVWKDGARPVKYLPGNTAIVFSPADIATKKERKAVAGITVHCLGCHSDAADRSTPFPGDTNTPLQYAWDGQSIESRYANKGVSSWGKYSTATTNKKNRVDKALSAHGNAVANRGGWSAGSGYDGTIPLTRGGVNAQNIECFDCHNAHGSAVPGITTSYRSFNGTPTGGLLKDTNSGKSGYKMSYTPSANDDTASTNPYNPGAGLCFDCHETAAAGKTPWGYKTTFGATEPIIGYKDTPRFGTGSKGSTARFSDRQSRSTIASSHLKAGRFLSYSAHRQISGLCTPCHDPHGVSRTLGGKMPYALPLLKGSWLTSPYREDGPPASTLQKDAAPKGGSDSSRGIAWEKGDYSFTNREANANFGVSGGGAPREPMSRAGMKYSVDRNTFGANKHISENDDLFAGLCLNCHTKEKLAEDGRVGRIHRTVKGWGNNREHAFPCSKCHQAHNSGLPRLMQTNCFEVGPPGLRDSSGLAWAPEKKGEQKAAARDEPKKSPAAKSKKSGKVEIVGCHVRQFGGNPAKQAGAQWNEKEKW